MQLGDFMRRRHEHFPHLQLLGYRWFNCRESQVGIILTRDELTGEFKAFIGTVIAPSQEWDDIWHVVAWGTRLSLAEAQPFFLHTELTEKEKS